jgi:hypothetical protein
MSEPYRTAPSALNTMITKIMDTLPILYPIKNFIIHILHFIPELLQKRDVLSILYIYNAIEFLLLIVSIIIIYHYAHNAMFSSRTPEGIVFFVFLTLILMNVVHTTYLFLYKADVQGWAKALKTVLYSWSLYLIVFVFSFILWFLSSLPGWIWLVITGVTQFIKRVLVTLPSGGEESRMFVKYGALYGIIFAVIMVLFYAALDPAALSTNTFTYAMLIIVPLLVVLSLVIPFSNSRGINLNAFKVGIVVLFLLSLVYFYAKTNKNAYEVVSFITLVLTTLMILGGLSILFYVVGNYLKSLSGWPGFIVYFIFYIPCLLIDFVKYILNEARMTASPIFVLLIVELIVILCYIYLPSAIKRINTSKNITLLPGSAFLDIGQTLENGKINIVPPFIKTKNNLLMPAVPVYNQNYAFSMWVYLNPQARNFVGYANESTIFNYNPGESAFGGKPKITYFNDTKNAAETNALDQYCIYFTNDTTQHGFYKFSMPSQKWNNIVVNFTSTHADLFVNGNLEYSYVFEGNYPMYQPTDFITIGQDQGLDGAICNVVYFPAPLSLIEITNNYNILSLRNPPTLN